MDTLSKKNSRTQMHTQFSQSFQGSLLLRLRVSSWISHLHVSSGLPEAQREDTYEKVLGWVNRTRCNWILKCDLKGTMNSLPFSSVPVKTPGPQLKSLSKGNISSRSDNTGTKHLLLLFWKKKNRKDIATVQKTLKGVSLEISSE